MSNSDNIPSAVPLFGIRGVPPAVKGCFPTSDPDCFPADRLPPALSSLLLEEVAGQGARLGAVAAATLLATAAAIGGSMRLEIDGGRTIGPTFNLCYAVPAFVRNAGAIEPVISPLRHRIQAFQN